MGMAAMTSMPLVAPLFIENGELSTTVTVVNAMIRATTVDVILLDQSGATITQQTYALDGHSQQAIDVSDLLRAANSAAFFGSVKIESDMEAEMNMGVLGQVSISGTGRGNPVYLEEEFPMMGPHDSGVFRAVAPAGLGFPVLALRSTSTSPQTVTVGCLYEHGNAGQSIVQLAPGAMVLSGACVPGMEQLPSLDAGWNEQALDPKGATGISVASSAGAGALCVYGFVIAGQAAHPIYSALNFTDAGSVNSGTTIFPGVPEGQASLLGTDVYAPALALANFGTTTVTASVVNAATNDNGPTTRTLATVTVPAQSSVTVPLGGLNGDPQMRNSFVVHSNAANGTLYAGMTVFGGNAVPAVQLLGKDWWELYNAGAHPWTTAGDLNSTLPLFNCANAPTTFFVRISAGGAWWQQTYQLAALETKAIDIGALIANGAKDSGGAAMPKETTSGMVVWYTMSLGQGMGRLLVSQPGAGLARNFSCQNFLAQCSALVSNGNITVAAGSRGGMGPYEVTMCLASWQQCYGSPAGTSPTPATWSSSNTSVATLSPSGDTTDVNGVAAGLATITATAPRKSCISRTA
jgi:hypothetical protein